ncbi:hypothetical protein, partial [Pseudomonas viridiflava]|uniref:hypothetical protein n=1 Tax=Pseudomonas viridiflava TaxID=33069 RepID=UPI003D662FE2
MPAFSRTFASDGAASAVLLEICSAMGVTVAKSTDSESSGKQTGMMDDCPIAGFTSICLFCRPRRPGFHTSRSPRNGPRCST